jgi:hypothetical protein
MKPTVRMFVSYSHQDREWFAKVAPLLKFKCRMAPIEPWHDQELKAGALWDKEIRDALGKMDVFLCLVSYYFLASDYITKVEMKEALQRQKAGKTIIVPLLLSDMEPKDIKHLNKFNPLPVYGRSWRSYEMNGGNTMDAHKPIRTGLWQAIEQVLEGQGQ